MAPTLPQQIAAVSGTVFATEECLMLPGLSAETRRALEGWLTEDRRTLRTLRREFQTNQKVLDAARVSG